MAQMRKCDAVLWDLHGAFIENNVDPPSLGPLAGKQHWANCARETLVGAGAAPEQLLRDHLDPVTFWRKRMMLELTMSRERHGKIIPERRFQELVNIALLYWVAPEFVCELDRRVQVRLARTLRRKRRSDNARHTLYPDMRAVAHWTVEDLGIMLYLITAQSRCRTRKLLARCNAPQSLFLRLYTSEEVGLPKSHPRFWKIVQESAGYTANQVICIEDSLSIGANALRSGLALILVDRDGATKTFIRDELSGRLAQAPLLEIGEALPAETPFVVCARGPRDIKRCIQSMRYVSRGER